MLKFGVGGLVIDVDCFGGKYFRGDRSSFFVRAGQLNTQKHKRKEENGRHLFHRCTPVWRFHGLVDAPLYGVQSIAGTGLETQKRACGAAFGRLSAGVGGVRRMPKARIPYQVWRPSLSR